MSGAELFARLNALPAAQQRVVAVWQDSGLTLRESLARVEDAETDRVYEAVFGRADASPVAPAAVTEAQPAAAAADDPYEALFGRGAR